MEMNKEMLKKFCKDRKIKNKTIQTYESAIKQYEEYYDMSIEDLIWEALNEQGQGKPEVQQKLFNRLEEYRDHLYNTNLAPSTMVNSDKLSAIASKIKICVLLYSPILL